MSDSDPASVVDTAVGARPLIASGDSQVLDELSRLCAAASVTPEVVADPDRVRLLWSNAPLVLVGADQARDVAALSLGLRSGVVLVSGGGESAEVWRQAVALRAEEVAVLPDAQSWLIRRLSDVADGAGRPCTTIGVIGGCGGAGASTFAAALGLTAARDRRTLLVDADPAAGGLELLLGCEDLPGLRWPEVTATEGRVNAAALRSALPEVANLALLSWRRGSQLRPDPATVAAILDAGRRGADLVVTDLSRRLEGVGADALMRVDSLLLVVPADVRAVAGASSLIEETRSFNVHTHLVARQSSTSDLAPSAVADALGLRLAAVIDTQRRIARSVSEGAGPLARGRMQRTAQKVLDLLAQPRGVADDR